MLLLHVACTDEPPPPGDNTDSLADQPRPPATSSAATPAAQYDSIFGVVASRNDTTCLRVPQTSARLADSVLVMIPNEHRSLHARIMYQLDACLGEAPEPTLAYFRLSVTNFEAGELGIAVLDTMVSLLRPIRTDVDRNLAPDTYRACTSSEGVHLTVWSGEPLRTDRLWHYYHYLGYDTEPNCVEADYAETPASTTGR